VKDRSFLIAYIYRIIASRFQLESTWDWAKSIDRIYYRN